MSASVVQSDPRVERAQTAWREREDRRAAVSRGEHTFTRDELREMSLDEFVEHEAEIDRQMRLGLIK